MDSNSDQFHIYIILMCIYVQKPPETENAQQSLAVAVRGIARHVGLVTDSSNFLRRDERK